MTDLADKIVSALFDLADSDGGLVKSRAVERVDEVLAAASQAPKIGTGQFAKFLADKQIKEEADEPAKRVTDRQQKAEAWEFLKKSLVPVTMPKQFFVGLDKAERPDFWSLCVKHPDGYEIVHVGDRTFEFDARVKSLKEIS